MKDIELDVPGTQFGRVELDDLSIPMVSMGDGKGPVLFLNAGTHGDEFEGPIALRNVLRQIRSEKINGQLIAIPGLNRPAIENCSRKSPRDGHDLNRIFPGSESGDLSHRIAHFVQSEIIPRADFVVDLHAGGRDMLFDPYVLLTAPELLASDALYERTLAAAKAVGLPNIMVLDWPDREGTLDSMVEQQGKIFLCIESGYAGTASPETVRATEVAIRNMLSHFGLWSRPPVPANSPTAMFRIPTAGFVQTPRAGILEFTRSLGEELFEGEEFAVVHCLDDVISAPTSCRAAVAGKLVARKFPAWANHGDLICGIGVPVGADAELPATS